jgi:hypothetical protein
MRGFVANAVASCKPMARHWSKSLPLRDPMSTMDCIPAIIGWLHARVRWLRTGD